MSLLSGFYSSTGTRKPAVLEQNGRRQMAEGRGQFERREGSDCVNIHNLGKFSVVVIRPPSAFSRQPFGTGDLN